MFEIWYAPLVVYIIIFLAIISLKFRIRFLYMLWWTKKKLLIIVKSLALKFLEILITSKLAALIIIFIMSIFFVYISSINDSTRSIADYVDFDSTQLINDFVSWIIEGILKGISMIIISFLNLIIDILKLLFLGINPLN